MGIGGVFRDSGGDTIFAFSCPVGEGIALKAELLAILEGLSEALNLGLSPILVEGDASNVIVF